LHLLPYFGGRRLSSITTADVNAFILKRRKDVMVVGEDDERQERKYSNGEMNRELTTLKRILNLARQNGKLMHVPHVPMLKERNVRTGFFEREQIERILAHLPPAIRPAVRFAYITGWRIPSEVLKLQWRPPAADRRAQPGARRRSRARSHADDRAQDALGVRALQHRERMRPRRGREEAQRATASPISIRPRRACLAEAAKPRRRAQWSPIAVPA
jgi:hypothetical protein